MIVLLWQYFMFGKHNGFVSKARVSACMYFLIKYYLAKSLVVSSIPVSFEEDNQISVQGSQFKRFPLSSSQR
jgi:hypothetical protein